MSERFNRVYLFIGDQGTGKTSFADVFAKDFLKLSPNNKNIVIDTDAHPFYDEYEQWV